MSFFPFLVQSVDFLVAHWPVSLSIRDEGNWVSVMSDLDSISFRSCIEQGELVCFTCKVREVVFLSFPAQAFPIIHSHAAADEKLQLPLSWDSIRDNDQRDIK